MNSSAHFRAARLLCLLALGFYLGAAAPHRAFAQGSLTPADIAGPDGIVYPDWRLAGVPGGIPTGLVVRTSITNHGGQPNDNIDDAAALEAAAEAAFAAGGGVVTIPAGTFHLSRPVLIRRSNVVLRGAGRNNTKFVFQYKAPTAAVAFYRPTSGTTTVYSNTWIEIHADPVGLERLEIFAKVAGAGDSTLQSCAFDAKADGHWGATYSLSTSGGTVMSKTAGAGSRELVARATYTGNVVREKRVTHTFSNTSDANALPKPSSLAAINFCGVGTSGSNRLLTSNGARGQTAVNLASGHGFLVGDAVEIRAPATDRWDAEVQNANSGESFRICQYKVTAVTATSVTLNQPLRIDYPTIDGSYLRQIKPITRCGVEGLSVEQQYDLWTSGIIFSWAWECWAKDVLVKKAGRFPLYFIPAKWCEVRDSVMDDAWFKGDGGTAYVGFERAYDCLMDNMTTYKMRHAPLVQWSAAGNVVRNSTFYDSDAQWHAGWTNENLFENCTVLSNRGNGAYGYGMWSSPPDDVAHGPNGPRNVIYNSDISSPLDGVWLGGMNREWRLMHNRFAMDSGAGVFAQKNSGDHIIENNVFVLRQATAGIVLKTADCDGVELVNNDFIGLPSTREIVTGAASPVLNVGNSVSDLVQLLPFSNSGFESDLAGWTRPADDYGHTQVSTLAARSGSKGIRITDSSTSTGSSLYSPSFPVTAGRVYSARCSSRVISGNNGTGIYLRFFSATGTNMLEVIAPVGSNTGWQLVQAIGTAPAGATTAQLWVHSYGGATQTADLDEFSFGEVAHGIPDPSFDANAGAWDNANDNGMSVVSTAAKRSGTNGLRVTDNSTSLGSSYATGRFPATPGHTYQVRFWSRRISGSGIAMYLKWFDSNGTYLSESPTEFPSSPDWKEYLARALAPPGAASMRVWIHSYIGSTVTADFDDFTLLALPPRPSTPTPSIFAWQRNPVFPFSNPGFESGLTGWQNTDDNGMTVVSGSARRSGSNGIRVTDPSSSAGSSLRSQRFPVVEGKVYQASFWARLVSGNGIGVYLIFRDANGQSLPNPAIQGIPTGTTAWTSFSFTSAAPAGAIEAEIWVHLYSANIVTADLDDFGFRAVLN